MFERINSKMKTIQVIVDDPLLKRIDRKCGNGMPSTCVINLYNLQTVQKQKIGKLITILNAKKMQEVGESLLFALGFDDLLAFD